jgi:hypothetical protein
LEKKVFILGSEGIGRGDDNIGYQILVDLLESLDKREEGPVAIVFWNTAVRLLADDSPLVPRFKRLQEKGVKILLGKSCIGECELTGRIAVGEAATMDEIMDLMLHHEVVNL